MRVQPKWNYYRCPNCHSFYVTVDVDLGITPMQIRCWDRPTAVQRGRELRPGCRDQMMQSADYPDPATWPAEVPRVAMGEWYLPTLFERMRLKKKAPALYQHVHEGGLLLRHTKVAHVFPQPQEV